MAKTILPLVVIVPGKKCLKIIPSQLIISKNLITYTSIGFCVVSMEKVWFADLLQMD